MLYPAVGEVFSFYLFLFLSIIIIIIICIYLLFYYFHLYIYVDWVDYQVLTYSEVNLEYEILSWNLSPVVFYH